MPGDRRRSQVRRPPSPSGRESTRCRWRRRREGLPVRRLGSSFGGFATPGRRFYRTARGFVVDSNIPVVPLLLRAERPLVFKTFIRFHYVSTRYKGCGSRPTISHLYLLGV